MTQQISEERQELSDQVASEPASIDIWVIRPTQIKVTDANDQVLIDTLQPRGSLTMEGIAPFHVIVDQVQNIDMNINNKNTIINHIHNINNNNNNTKIITNMIII